MHTLDWNLALHQTNSNEDIKVYSNLLFFYIVYIQQYLLFWEYPLGVPPGLQGGGGVLHWSSRGTYKGATAITDKSISDPARKLKLFIEVQNPKEFFQYFDV